MQFGIGDRDQLTAGEAQQCPGINHVQRLDHTHDAERGSVIYDSVAKQKTSKGAVDTIFLSILGRRPTVTELTIASEIETSAQPGSRLWNLIWGLLNTREFMFIQ